MLQPTAELPSGNSHLLVNWGDYSLVVEEQAAAAVHPDLDALPS